MRRLPLYIFALSLFLTFFSSPTVFGQQTSDSAVRVNETGSRNGGTDTGVLSSAPEGLPVPSSNERGWKFFRGSDSTSKGPSSDLKETQSGVTGLETAQAVESGSARKDRLEEEEKGFYSGGTGSAGTIPAQTVGASSLNTSSRTEVSTAQSSSVGYLGLGNNSSWKGFDAKLEKSEPGSMPGQISDSNNSSGEQTRSSAPSSSHENASPSSSTSASHSSSSGTGPGAAPPRSVSGSYNFPEDGHFPTFNEWRQAVLHFEAAARGSSSGGGGGAAHGDGNGNGKSGNKGRGEGAGGQKREKEDTTEESSSSFPLFKGRGKKKGEQRNNGDSTTPASSLGDESDLSGILDAFASSSTSPANHEDSSSVSSSSLPSPSTGSSKKPRPRHPSFPSAPSSPLALLHPLPSPSPGSSSSNQQSGRDRFPASRPNHASLDCSASVLGKSSGMIKGAGAILSGSPDRYMLVPCGLAGANENKANRGKKGGKKTKSSKKKRKEGDTSNEEDDGKELASLDHEFTSSNNDRGNDEGDEEEEGASSSLSPHPSQPSSPGIWILVELCEEIELEAIALANLEFFSSGFKEVRVRASAELKAGSGSGKAGGNDEDWTDVGVLRARNVRGLQIFPLPVIPGFFRYLRLDFLTHYGKEFYCPVSILKVYGLTQIEAWRRDQERERLERIRLEQEVEEIQRRRLLELDAGEGVIQPVEVKIQEEDEGQGSSSPRVSESESETEEPRLETGARDAFDSGKQATIDPVSQQTVRAESSSSSIHESADSQLPQTSSSSSSVESYASPTPVSFNATVSQSSSVLNGNTSNPSTLGTAGPLPKVENGTSFSSSTSISSGDMQSPNESAGKPRSNTASSSSRLLSSPIISDSAVRSNGSRTSTITSTSTRVAPIPPPPAFPHGPAGGTESKSTESIFSAITKRLNMLEGNATLSMQYMEAQGRWLAERFARVDEKLKNFDVWRRNHDAMLGRVVLDLQFQRAEMERERVAIHTELDMLAKDVNFEKRLGVAQLVGLLSLFFFVAVTRGAPPSNFVFPPRRSFMIRTPTATTPIDTPAAASASLPSEEDELTRPGQVFRNRQSSYRQQASPNTGKSRSTLIPASAPPHRLTQQFVPPKTSRRQFLARGRPRSREGLLGVKFRQTRSGLQTPPARFTQDEVAAAETSNVWQDLAGPSFTTKEFGLPITSRTGFSGRSEYSKGLRPLSSKLRISTGPPSDGGSSSHSKSRSRSPAKENSPPRSERRQRGSLDRTKVVAPQPLRLDTSFTDAFEKGKRRASVVVINDEDEMNLTSHETQEVDEEIQPPSPILSLSPLHPVNRPMIRRSDTFGSVASSQRSRTSSFEESQSRSILSDDADDNVDQFVKDELYSPGLDAADASEGYQPQPEGPPQTLPSPSDDFKLDQERPFEELTWAVSGKSRATVERHKHERSASVSTIGGASSTSNSTARKALSPSPSGSRRGTTTHPSHEQTPRLLDVAS